GSAKHATSPKRTDVTASLTNSQKYPASAIKPAVAGPNAQPALNAMRYAEKAVTRWPAGTRSANNALLAGRYNSPAKPASAVKSRITGKLRAWESSIIVIAAENSESTMAL